MKVKRVANSSGKYGTLNNQIDRSDKSNNKCFECREETPQWISVNNGIFICLNCAGAHRGFGV